MEQLQDIRVAVSVVSQGQDRYAKELQKSRQFYRETKYYADRTGQLAERSAGRQTHEKAVTYSCTWPARPT